MKTEEINICSICGKEITREENSISTGYATNKDGEKICYQCCGELDKKELSETGVLHGYLSKDEAGYYFGNWPGTLKIRVYGVRKSWHNFAGKDGRRDFWLQFNGGNYHVLNIGDNECAKVKRCKK